jgi:hypothetical protein
MSAANAGSPSLNILVEGVDDTARRCGLSEDSVSSQASLTLRANGIRVRETNTNPYLYVNLNIVFLEGLGVCVANVSVRVEGLTPQDMLAAPLGGFRARKGQATILCESSLVITHPLNLNPGAAILAAIETITKTCLGKLDY